MNTNNFEDELEGLVKLTDAVFGIPTDEEGESTARDEQELVELVRLVQKALTKLPERELRVVSMRFGFGDFVGNPHTLEEVAWAEAVTRERVRQIEQKMLAHMREFIRGE